MASLTLMNKEETKSGYSTQKMAGLITSLWLTCENLGSFLGATGGGAAYDRFGWSSSCLVVAGLNLFSVIIILIVFVNNNCCKRNKTKYRAIKDEAKRRLLDGRIEAGYGTCQ